MDAEALVAAHLAEGREIWDAEVDDVLVCRQVRPETHDVKTFVLEGRRRQLFRYRPGQFLTFDFEIGFPVSQPVKVEGRVINSALPAVTVVRSVYTGPYEGLAQAWPALQNWVRSNGHGETGKFWECYLTNPEEVKDPKNYRTELNWIVG